MGHDHNHQSAGKGPSFALGIGLNVAFVAVETAYGVASGSMALVADAVHNLSDVLGLVLAWVAIRLAARRPTARRTYGLRKSTVLSALANAVLLLVAVGGIAWEAVGRFSHPAPVQGGTVMLVAAIGVLINGASAALFARGSEHDVNLRGAFLHLAADAAVSAGVVVSGYVVLRTGWTWIDPSVSIAISFVVLLSTWGLLRNSLDLALDAVPAGVDMEAVRAFLATLPQVTEIHDLHVWAISTTDVALTAHLIVGPGPTPRTFVKDVAAKLQDNFNIGHATLQVEPIDAEGECVLAHDKSI